LQKLASFPLVFSLLYGFVVNLRRLVEFYYDLQTFSAIYIHIGKADVVIDKLPNALLTLVCCWYITIRMF